MWRTRATAAYIGLQRAKAALSGDVERVMNKRVMCGHDTVQDGAWNRGDLD